jgi:hypothetical protein
MFYTSRAILSLVYHTTYMQVNEGPGEKKRKSAMQNVRVSHVNIFISWSLIAVLSPPSF